MEKIEIFKQWVQESKHIVFFGGAGVSTESGIPDFRGRDGLYNQQFDYPPETILSHRFFLLKPSYFYDFYRKKMLPLGYEPNITHRKLAQLEAEGKLDVVITQNIDGLHQKAGSKKVYELHGSALRNYCSKCKKFYSAEYIKESTGVPYCECGGLIKPDVVLYDEPLDGQTVLDTINAIRAADMLIIAGTSLTVHPAADFIGYFSGNYLVYIDLEGTPFDFKVDMVIQEPLGKVFSQL